MEAQIVIAGLDFNNTSGDTSIGYLKSDIPESMHTCLANYKEFAIVERSRLQDVLKEIQLAQSVVIDESTAAKIGNAVGASAIIIGSYLKVGSNIRINARLLDVASGKSSWESRSKGMRNRRFSNFWMLSLNGWRNGFWGRRPLRPR
jgi:TolB-like protein